MVGCLWVLSDGHLAPEWKDLEKEKRIMRKSLFLGLFGALALVSGLSGGCGAISMSNPLGQSPSLVGDVWVEQEVLQADGSKRQNFGFISKGTGPNGENEIHNMSVSVGSDPVNGTGYGNFSGDTFIVENTNGNVQTSPFQPDDPNLIKGLGRGWINIQLAGSFVPGNGEVTEAMEMLENVPLSSGASQSINSLENPEPIPGCESGEKFNSITGEYCPPDFSYETLFYYNWYCTSEYRTPEDPSEKDWGFGNCWLNVNGGVIDNVNIYAGQTLDADKAPWNQSQWQINISFRVLVTGKIRQPSSPPVGGGGGVVSEKG